MKDKSRSDAYEHLERATERYLAEVKALGYTAREAQEMIRKVAREEPPARARQAFMK